MNARPSVLIGCESLGVVREAFRKLGCDAWSCDLLPAADGSPFHLVGDVRYAVDEQNGFFFPQLGGHVSWDLFICHPPCTYLTISAAWAFGDGPYHQKVKPGTLTGAARRAARAEAIVFVRDLWHAPVKRKAFENPRGFLSSMWRPPSQTIQPYEFGSDASKGTCLWLDGLPLLVGTKYVEPRLVCSDCGNVFKYGQHKCPSCNSHSFRPRWANQTDAGQNRLSPSDDRWQKRSETFPGIAQAMAAQRVPVLRGKEFSLS